MPNDLVSIIMPSYNSAGFISESIESVIAQTYPHWELLITDDCSTDNTVEIVQQYVEKDERIKLFVLSENSGAAVARNKSIKEAKGRYIALLDSDDLWKREKLDRQVRFMRENNRYFSYHKYEEIDEQGTPLNFIVGGKHKIRKNEMLFCCWPGCLTVMYDREKVGLIQIGSIKKNNDFALWIEINRNVPCYLLDKELAQYRRRRGSITTPGIKDRLVWHYRLFNRIEHLSAVGSIVLVLINVFMNVIKKTFYTHSSVSVIKKIFRGGVELNYPQTILGHTLTYYSFSKQEGVVI